MAYDELTNDEQAELELHLHGCPECEGEWSAITAFHGALAHETAVQVSPNLLAAARMHLDDALDEAGGPSLLMRLRSGLLNTWQHLYAAPALATLLVGMGFLSGNLLTRYQVAHRSAAGPTDGVPPGFTSGLGTVGAVSGIVQTSDPDVVQVSYNRMVPTTITGRIEEPEVRSLLMDGARNDNDTGIREQSVAILANECRSGHRCEHANDGSDSGVRDALLVRLRYDRNARVRLNALMGLQRFVGEDQKVRDAVLESLLHDTSADVRTRAIGMLEPVEGDSSVRQVLHTVSTQDENPYIRNVSMQALGTADGIQ